MYEYFCLFITMAGITVCMSQSVHVDYVPQSVYATVPHKICNYICPRVCLNISPYKCILSFWAAYIFMSNIMNAMALLHVSENVRYWSRRNTRAGNEKLISRNILVDSRKLLERFFTSFPDRSTSI